MTNPLPPLNLSAVAAAVRGEVAKPAPSALRQPASAVLVPRFDQAAGVAIPRGGLLDIVV